MTAPTATRRPTAKQREFLNNALTDGSLSAPTTGLQDRTLKAMIADGWVAELDGEHAAITLQGAIAIGKRVEFAAEQDRIAALDPPALPTLPAAPAVDEVAELEQGWRWTRTDDLSDCTVEAVELPAEQFTHSCDRCGRRFAGEFPTWDDRCGFCKWGTINGLAPHMGGRFADSTLPVHYKVPNTVTAACFHAARESAPDNAQMTTDMRKATCDACLDVDLDEKPVEVDPAPGTLADLLALVDLYGDERAEAGQLLDGGGRDEYLGHVNLAKQHREQIETVARNLLGGELPAREPGGPSGARVVNYPDAGAHNRLLARALDDLERAAGDPENRLRRTYTARRAVVEVVEQVALGVADECRTMTRTHARKLVDDLVTSVAADVEADAEGYSDDTLDVVERLVTALGGPDGGFVAYRGVVDVELPEQDVEPEPVASSLPAAAPGDDPEFVVGEAETVPSVATLLPADEHAAAIAEILSSQPDGVDREQVFVFTFGGGHEDPQTGESLTNRYTVVVADDRTAAERDMFERYGDQWAFGYDLDAAADMLVRFPEMVQVRLADLLPAIPLRRLGLGVNGYTLRGADGTTLFRASWVAADKGFVDMACELPGLELPASDGRMTAEFADEQARHLLQAWTRRVLGLQVRVALESA